MRLLDQRSMQRLYAVTDEIPIDRETIEVPLQMQGGGSIERLEDGKLRITLPDTDDIGPFLERLPARVQQLL